MNNYTLDDIETLIEIMEKSQLIRTKNITKYIPIVGMKIYKRALFEQTKIEVFRKKLEEAKFGSIEEQQNFIDKFSPILEYLHFPTKSERETQTKGTYKK